MAKSSVRMSADERRESVVRAAISEFAKHGYHGTSTEAIARRVGVSQPYLFRLFGNKQAIFLAAAQACTDDIRRAFEQAAEGVEGGASARGAMGAEYARLVVDDRERLMMQMQMYVAVGSAEIEGDVEFGKAVRASWSELYDLLHERLGADPAATAEFMGQGMLINVLLLLGYPADDRVWQGVR